MHKSDHLYRRLHAGGQCLVSLCRAESAETLISRIPAGPCMLPVAKAFRHMIATKGPSLHDDSSSLPFLSTHNTQPSTLNSSAERKHPQSCHPYLAWCIGIASSRGMSRASRLPSNGPPRHWTRSLLAAPKHNSSPYSYETPPSTLSTSLPVFARASPAGTAPLVALSRPQSDTSPLVLVPDPSSTAPRCRNRGSAPRSPNPLDVLPSHRRSDRA